MPPEKESLQEFIERIAWLTAIAEKHGVTVDILVPHREILLMTISRCGIRATLEAKHQGKSFNLTLHGANPRGASGADFEGMIKAFLELDLLSDLFKEAGVHADEYVRDGMPVALVLWRNNETMPFLCLKDSGDGELSRFTLLSSDDVPPHDCRRIHPDTVVKLLNRDGLPIAASLWREGNDEPLLSFGKISSELIAHQEVSVEIGGRKVLTKPKG